MKTPILLSNIDPLALKKIIEKSRRIRINKEGRKTKPTISICFDHGNRPDTVDILIIPFCTTFLKLKTFIEENDILAIVIDDPIIFQVMLSTQADVLDATELSSFNYEFCTLYPQVIESCIKDSLQSSNTRYNLSTTSSTTTIYKDATDFMLSKVSTSFTQLLLSLTMALPAAHKNMRVAICLLVRSWILGDTSLVELEDRLKQCKCTKSSRTKFIEELKRDSCSNTFEAIKSLYLTNRTDADFYNISVKFNVDIYELKYISSF